MNKHNTTILTLAIMAVTTLLFAGCSSGRVIASPTAKGQHYTATKPNDIEIFRTKPDKPYTEIGTVTVRASSNMLKMNIAIRAQAARLGADAVIITSEGVDKYGASWANGAAIKYKQ